jgi:leader peptidase (prepilin peptidase) / N-methyltransferase
LAGGLLEGLLVVFIASLLGSLASLPMLLQRKLKRTSIIPFGPFLMMATVIVVLYGPRLIDWFDGLFLLG